MHCHQIPSSRPSRHWSSGPLAILLSIALLLAACSGLDDEENYHRPDGEGPWILVDLWHTTIQNPEDYRLEKGNYNYQGVFGFHRLFQHLDAHGYNWTSIRTMPLSRQRLEGFDVLFINLVHDARPDFTADEIEAIQKFVHEGGGLFVIADHSNVYRHAERLNPLLMPMGIEVMFHTAVDYPPNYSVGGKGWIMLSSFAEHPVSAGLEVVSFQTGGTLATEAGVAFTSDMSFADLWDENQTHGYYGNWTWDGDPEAEPKGPLPGVAAAEYGQGRVVVVADQNIFGDAWIHFGHNFELALNGFEWLAKQSEQPRRLRDTRPRGTNIALDTAHGHFKAGRTGNDGYYNFFVHLNRDTEVTGRARPQLEEGHDVLVFLSPHIEFTEEDLDLIRGYLQDGRRVVITFEANDIPQATLSLIHELAPDFTLSVGERTYAVAEETDREAMERLPVSRVAGHHELKSSAMSVEGLSLASFKTPLQDGAAEPDAYLWRISSSWGDPFLQAQSDDGFLDLARHKVVDKGELIIFFQDGFFRNRTIGHKEVVPPNAYNEDAIRLQYRLLDYLKKSRG